MGMDTAKALGFSGLWKGLTPRIVMIGTLTALQWFIYDGVKVALNLPRPPPTSYARVDEEETGRCPAIGKQLRNNRKMSGKIINTLSSSPPTDSDLGILLDLET